MTIRRQKHRPDEDVAKLRSAQEMLNVGKHLSAVLLSSSERSIAGDEVRSESQSKRTCAIPDEPQAKRKALFRDFCRETGLKPRVLVPPRGVEFLQNPREIPQSRKIPDQIPDQLGWPPISTRWFDSSANCRTDSARPS
jgi:hypothetical protein